MRLSTEQRESSGVRAVVQLPDGSLKDITEGVQALYDLLLSSMDWGSGFWTYEDAVPVANLAEVMGFREASGTRAYVEAQRFSEEQDQFVKDRRLPSKFHLFPHEDHVLSALGRCLWPLCPVGREKVDDA